MFPIMFSHQIKKIKTEWKVHVMYNKKKGSLSKTKLFYFEYLNPNFHIKNP